MNVSTTSAPHSQPAAAAVPAGGRDAMPPRNGPWAVLQTSATVVDVRDKARALSKQGKLPGFGIPVGTAGADSDVFHHVVFGEPFDHDVRCVALPPQPGPAPGDTRLEFHARMQPRLPLIFALITLLTIWPGVWLTDSLIKTYFPSYDWNTYAWYLPVTILPIPWMTARMITRSRRASYAHFQDKLALLREVLRAR